MPSDFRQRRPLSVSEALPGRDTPILVPGRHFVLGTAMDSPFAEGQSRAVFALGCFWGAERCFWTESGVTTTAVGYAGGITPNPTYREVCSGRTDHAEVVLVGYDPEQVTYEHLLRRFWESHDPTQGMRQGNDIGTQYRSGIYFQDEDQRRAAEASRDAYQVQLRRRGFGTITTEIEAAGPFYFAEEEHQQYLAKNPRGYCGLGGTGVACPTGL